MGVLDGKQTNGEPAKKTGLAGLVAFDLFLYRGQWRLTFTLNLIGLGRIPFEVTGSRWKLRGNTFAEQNSTFAARITLAE